MQNKHFSTTLNNHQQPVNNIDRHIIHTHAPLREAFRKLNALSGGNMTLFVIDPERGDALVGSLTDGDLRRAVIAEASLDRSVGQACRKDCMKLTSGADRFRAITEARRRGIALLPVIDKETGAILELIDLQKVKSHLPLDAVLMAGGKGERLRPLTLDCPKPLLPVGDKAIIDYNIDELRANGINNIYVTVNYLKEQIIQHFSAPEYSGCVKCVEEPRRLGTIGSLSLITEGLKEENLLLMNSDLLTTLSYEKMYLQHVASGAAVTMGVIPYSVSIPFAIIRSEGRRITGLTEKPTYNYFANAGVYMIRREFTERLPKGEYMDAPDFIEQLIAAGEKVEYYPIEGLWIDIGSPDDYRYANELSKVAGGLLR